MSDTEYEEEEISDELSETILGMGLSLGVEEGITDLPGVGPSTAKKLEEAGYGTLAAIATASIAQLTSIASLGEKTAAKLIEVARHSLDLSFETAEELLQRRKNLARLTTGSQALDSFFGSGIETGSITEFFGEFRSGKTQLAHQLCVTSQLPMEMGGLKKKDSPPPKAFYIDTEGTFRPERILAMATRYPEQLDPSETLANISVGRAYNSDHQIVLADQVCRQAQTEEVGVMVVDSLTSHFRAEYIGRGTLAARQQKLNSHIHGLLRGAEVAGMAIIVTNQVSAKPDMFFGDPTSPVGGHVVAHSSTTRVYLRKSKGTRRIARIVDSPLLPESEAVFAITEDGILDIEG